MLIYNPIERFLWILVFIAGFTGGIIYLIKGIKRENVNDKLILIGFACFIIVRILPNVSFPFLSDFLIQGTYVNNNFYGDYNNITNVLLYEVLHQTFFSIAALGTTIFFFTFEKAVKRTKYILTLIYSVITVFIVILPYRISVNFSVYTVGIGSVLIIYFIFFLYTKWSRFEFKAISAFFSVGFTLIILGRNISGWKTDFILGIIPRIVPLYLSPILCLMGLILLLFPSIANPEVIKSAFRYWTIFGVGLGFLIIFELLVWFYSNNILLFITYIIGFNYYLILVYIIIKNIRTEIKSGKSTNDILSMFTRPQKITIKEVTFSKEQKVCLVCKGKVEELNFFACSHCAVLYCQNCAQTLSNLENACWVCNTPFDKSKPSKPYEIEEEEVEIEEAEEVPEKSKKK